MQNTQQEEMEYHDLVFMKRNLGMIITVNFVFV